MNRKAKIDAFVESLAEADTPDDQSVNIYRNVVRRANLIRWFSTFDNASQSAIFVGEAPGRDGGAITGIPFVSPMVLTSADDSWDEFGSETQYELPVGQDANHRERTATRFWKYVPSYFSELPRILTWNIYPFWPFAVSRNHRRINRAPTRREIQFGSEWLVRVVEMFPNAHVVAVGVKAHDTLESIGVDAPLVPHPSRGSDEKLINRLERIAGNLRHLD